MGFTLHTGHRLEALFDALADRLAADPLPPLATETVLVPGPGVARWLQLRLAERFGIAGGLRMPFFGAFLRELLSPGADDPFRSEVLVFRLWRLLDVGRTDLGPATGYVRNDPDGSKRFQLCTRLAQCFDDYQLYRDDLLDAFAHGQTPAIPGPHVAWQGELWRALLQDAGIAPPRPRPPAGRGRRKGDRTPLLFGGGADDDAPAAVPRAHRLAALRELLASPDRARAQLPPRLTVFGSATLPPAFLRLLAQVAAIVPVDLYVPQPTPHYFGDARGRRADGENGLLVRLAGESREFAEHLLDAEQPGPGSAPLVRADDALDALDEPPPPTSLLACVQQDLVQALDRDGNTLPRFPIAVDDDSLRVHDCHSPHREMEVVRDQILAAFAAEPSLQPHDVMVLVPDIDRYAPYAQAVFGTTEKQLPFRVVDRSPARERPVCRTLLSLLRLARDRLTVFDVLHVLETAAVQRRFGVFPSDVPVLRHLCHEAGVRWGIDATSRADRFDLPAFAENSWRQGIERLLLGIATGPTDDVVLGRLPVGGSTGAHAELLQRFLGFLDALFAALGTATGAHPLTTWADRTDELVASMFAATDHDDEAGLQALRAATAELRRVAAAARHTDAVGATVFGDWLERELGRGGGGHGFLGGPVTIAAMQPLRAVPVRCLFLCGLDDQSFPHEDHPAPFDLMAAARRPGDRSRRLDDRQLFLDLLLAARDRVHMTFVGRSAKDNSPCTPSIVLVELLEHLERTCVVPSGSVRDHVVVPHPLQPWSRRYRDGSDARLFTFAARSTATATATQAPEPPWLPATPVAADAAPAPTTVALQDLIDFWWHPCRYFLRRSLGMRLRTYEDHERDDEPFLLDNLDRYQLENDLLLATLAGRAPRDPYEHARAAGLLPVGELGRSLHGAAAGEVRVMLAALPTTPPRTLPVDVTAGACRVLGELDGMHDNGVWYARPTSAFKPKDMLRCWLLHLVMTIATAGMPGLRPTHLVIRGKRRVYQPPTVDDARGWLAELVHLFELGKQAPLPFFERASYALANALAKGKNTTVEDALRKARGEWTKMTKDVSWDQGDDEDADIRQCMRGREPLTEPAFVDLARRVWRPLLDHLQEDAQ